MIAINQTQKQWVFAAGAIVFFFGFLLLVLCPQYAAVRKLVLDVRGAARDNAVLERQILTVNKSGRRLEDIQEKLHAYQAKTPSYEDLPYVLDVVASSAQADGLKVVSLQALDEQPASQTPAFLDQGQAIRFAVMNLQADGTFIQIEHYLEGLEKMPFEVLLQSVMFKNSVPVEAHSREPILAAEIRIEVAMRFPQKSL